MNDSERESAIIPDRMPGTVKNSFGRTCVAIRRLADYAFPEQDAEEA